MAETLRRAGRQQEGHPNSNKQTWPGRNGTGPGDLSTVVHKFTNVFRLRSGLLLYYVAGS